MEAQAFMHLHPLKPNTVGAVLHDATLDPLEIVPVPATKMDFYYEVDGKPTVRIIDID